MHWHWHENCLISKTRFYHFVFAVNPFSVPVRGGGADGPCSVTSRYKTFYKTYERFYILLVSSLGTVPVDLLLDIARILDIESAIGSTIRAVSWTREW